MSIVANLNKIKNWQAAVIITAIGFAVYFTGLNTPFQGDDTLQIVNNLPVHSVANIKLFFEGGTFYNGQGIAPLSGVYFRPLMTTVFSLIYTLFGQHPFYFHLFQLFACVSSAIILYLFLRYFFKPVLALLLALIFLIHPIDSQVVYAIPSMQDALFFFFGILALYLLTRFTSRRSLISVSICILFSLLSKETGILFMAIALLYLYWQDRKRLYPFVGVIVLPTALYLLLKVSAIGLLGANPNNAPVDNLSLGGRLLTVPSVVLFYITKFIFPWKLATVYYWTYSTFTIRHVLVPLLIDLVAMALLIYLGFLIRKRASKAKYQTYLFFTAWTFLGLVPCLQLIPLDMTVCETWFYFSMAGLLGMIGVTLTVFKLQVRPNWSLLVIAVLLICVLGFRTSIRGFDYGNQYILANKDIAASPDDYYAYNVASGKLIEQGNYLKAETYELRSIGVYPTYKAYNNLGVAYVDQGDYSAAFTAYKHVLEYKNGDTASTYEDLGELSLVYGNYSANRQLLLRALTQYPHNAVLWEYLALLEDMNNDNPDARLAIVSAAHYGQLPQALYEDITNDRSFAINLDGLNKNIEI